MNYNIPILGFRSDRTYMGQSSIGCGASPQLPISSISLLLSLHTFDAQDNSR